MPQLVVSMTSIPVVPKMETTIPPCKTQGSLQSDNTGPPAREFSDGVSKEPFEKVLEKVQARSDSGTEHDAGNTRSEVSNDENLPAVQGDEISDPWQNSQKDSLPEEQPISDMIRQAIQLPETGILLSLPFMMSQNMPVIISGNTATAVQAELPFDIPVSSEIPRTIVQPALTVSDTSMLSNVFRMNSAIDLLPPIDSGENAEPASVIKTDVQPAPPVQNITKENGEVQGFQKADLKIPNPELSLLPDLSLESARVAAASKNDRPIWHDSQAASRVVEDAREHSDLNLKSFREQSDKPADTTLNVSGESKHELRAEAVRVIPVWTRVIKVTSDGYLKGQQVPEQVLSDRSPAPDLNLKSLVTSPRIEHRVQNIPEPKSQEFSSVVVGNGPLRSIENLPSNSQFVEQTDAADFTFMSFKPLQRIYREIPLDTQVLTPFNGAAQSVHEKVFSFINTPTGVDMNKLVADVKESVIRLTSDGLGSARIVLHPPELGELVIRLENLRHGVIRAEFHTMNPVVRETLEAGLSRLTDALKAEGLTLTHAEVHLNFNMNANGRSGEFDQVNQLEGTTLQDSAENADAGFMDSLSNERIPEGATVWLLA